MLEVKKIGTGDALFYTSYALVFEVKYGKYTEALSTLQQGLSLRSNPLHKIETTIKNFRLSM
jgi:hypothetical protein